ncbi:hypothetical protein FI667_g9681, partial [Globisporangium splendens]
MVQFSHLVALALVLWSSSCEFAQGNLFSSILDINEVCPPDSFTCPHGGIAFRDRNHGCEFTPCEFVTPPAFAPTPAPVTPRTTNASRWFRNHEFFVPQVRFQDLKRGSNLAKRVTELLQVKSKRASLFVDFGEFTACVDLYAVASRFMPVQGQTTANASMAHEALLIEALSTDGDLMLAEQGSLLVTFWKPWTQFALFGWLTQYPSVRGILTMLRHVQKLNSLEVLMKRPLSRTHDVLQTAVEAASKQIIAIPSFVIMNATDDGAMEKVTSNDLDEASGDASLGWFSKQPEAVQVQVFEFLECQLFKMGHLELPVRSTDANSSTTKLDMEKNEKTNRSIGFAPRYGKTSASLVAFLTTFSSLLDSESGTKSNASLWNFTMLTCDEHETRLRAYPSVPLTELVASDSSSSGSQSSEASMTGSADFIHDDDTNSRNISAGKTGDHIFSCWFYQEIENLNGTRVADAAATTHAVRLYH